MKKLNLCLIVSKTGEGNDKPLQYCCLENPMDREPGGQRSLGLQELDTT